MNFMLRYPIGAAPVLVVMVAESTEARYSVLVTVCGCVIGPICITECGNRREIAAHRIGVVQGKGGT